MSQLSEASRPEFFDIDDEDDEDEVEEDIEEEYELAKYLKEYIRVARSAPNVNEAIESSRFDNSLNVFYDLQQTKAKQQIDNNDFLGYHKQMTGAMKTRSQLRKKSKVKLASGKNVPFSRLRGQLYVPKRAKPNRYRPVFSCKEAMLFPKHYDVLKTREYDREQSAIQTKKSGKEKKEEKGKEKEKKRKKRKNKGKAKWTKKTEQTRNIHSHEKRSTIEATASYRGTTTATIKKKMADNGISLHDIAIIQLHFQTCVRILNELQQRTFWACALWIDKILRDGSKDVQQQSNAVVDSKDFIHGLASILYHDDMGHQSNYRRSLNSSKPLPMSSQLQAYNLFKRTTNTRPSKVICDNISIFRAASMVVISVQAAL
ncbi:hypothetical protein BGX21_006044 [Mortierella sp. AD011]|nr:hypothetical protein BGX20_010823 [Mortierella sp. AD010]KAF9403973.1 hypothetical protein BGX21_006044 [Mortierella sp. AD011]